MFCTHCGKETADGSTFCPYCGTKVANDEPVTSEYSYTPEPAANQNPEPQYYQAAGYYAQNQYYQPQQPAGQVQGSYQPQYNYVNGYQPQPAGNQGTVAAKSGSKWPVSAAIMGIMSLFFYLAGGAASLIIDGMGIRSVISVSPVVFILMTVLYFVHTKKIAWITIIPFLIYIVSEIVAQYRTLRVLLSYGLSGWNMIAELLYVAFPLLLFIFYTLNVTIRPKGAALRVLYIVFMALEIVFLLISVYTMIYQAFMRASVGYFVYLLMLRIAFIFFFIGHGIATTSVRGR